MITPLPTRFGRRLSWVPGVHDGWRRETMARPSVLVMRHAIPGRGTRLAALRPELGGQLGLA